MQKIMELKTVQTNSFKTLSDALKEILTDVNIEFSPAGMKLVSMDQETRTILVHLKLDAKKFEYYKCEKEIIAGINLPNFYKLIQTLTNNDALTLYISSSNPNQMGIKIENGEKNCLTNYLLNLIEVDEEVIKIPPPKFESIIKMQSSEFNKKCRDMSNISNVIEIKSVSSQLIFACKGDFAEQETIMGETNDGLNYIKSGQDHDVIQGYYNLKHLNNFTKCAGLCTTLTIYLKNSFPIVIEFDVGNLGSLKLALAPKVKTDC
jgi:proliferating cell nuclear antigen